MSGTVLHPDGLVAPMIDFIASVDRRVAQLKQAVQAVEAARPGDLEGRPDEVDRLFEGACSDLANQVRQCATNAGLTNVQLGTETIADFSYLLAAWADEALVRGMNPQLVTRRLSVEERIFATRDAGEQVFANLDVLLARRSLGDVHLAPAYLLALSLGFRGQFRDEEAETVMRYHRALTALALGASRTAEAPAEHGAAPPTIGVLAWIGRYLPMPMLWAGIAVVWMAAILLTDLAWREAVAPLRASLAEIEGGMPLSDLLDGGSRR